MLAYQLGHYLLASILIATSSFTPIASSARTFDATLEKTSSGVSAVINATAITAGDGHTCALTNTGGVLCWGNNWYGELGDGTTTNRYTPVAVGGLSSGVIAIVAGAYHTCALTNAGGVLCWGNNSGGQLGDGTTTNRYTPVAVSGLSGGVVTIAADSDHTCALTNTEGVLCWGGNSDGQLGDGTTTNRYNASGSEWAQQRCDRYCSRLFPYLRIDEHRGSVVLGR